VAAVLLAGVAAGASSAAAATPAATLIQLALKFPTITYSNRQVTLSGVLDTNATVRQGIAGEQVHFRLLGPGLTTVLDDLGTVTTGADGTFALQTTAPTHRYTSIAPAAYLPSRAHFDSLPTQLQPGQQVTITGQAQVQLADGSWVPAPYTEFRESPGGYPIYAYMADSTGRFSFTFSEQVPTQIVIEINRGAWSFAGISSYVTQPIPL
jgi:hypothetical protein